MGALNPVRPLSFWKGRVWIQTRVAGRGPEGTPGQDGRLPAEQGGLDASSGPSEGADPLGFPASGMVGESTSVVKVVSSVVFRYFGLAKCAITRGSLTRRREGGAVCRNLDPPSALRWPSPSRSPGHPLSRPWQAGHLPLGGSAGTWITQRPQGPPNAGERAGGRARSGEGGLCSPSSGLPGSAEAPLPPSQTCS